MELLTVLLLFVLNSFLTYNGDTAHSSLMGKHLYVSLGSVRVTHKFMINP